jgi:hypothetical protein
VPGAHRVGLVAMNLCEMERQPLARAERLVPRPGDGVVSEAPPVPGLGSGSEGWVCSRQLCDRHG